MNTSRLTEDYAILSLMTGYFAAAADKFLGGQEFQNKTYAEVDNFTWEMLAQWQQEAIDKGVPPEAMKMPEGLIILSKRAINEAGITS